MKLSAPGTPDLPPRAMKRLNLGSAAYKKAGYINVDWQSIVEPDVNHDLNVFPYPFETDEFEHLLEEVTATPRPLQA